MSAFRDAPTERLVPCQGCGASVDPSTTTFGPDGRSLCRTCYGHLAAKQADARKLEGYGGATFAPIGKFATGNPRAFLWFLKMALFLVFILVVGGVALAAAFGEWLHHFLER